MRDVLTAAAWRRLAAVAPATVRWAAGALALRAARMRLIERREAPERFVMSARALLSDAWTRTDEMGGLRAALPPAAAAALADAQEARALWRAELRWRADVEAEGFRLLRSHVLGPDVALGAFAVLWIDAQRICAALADAEAGGGEALDVVA